MLRTSHRSPASSDRIDLLLQPYMFEEFPIFLFLALFAICAAGHFEAADKTPEQMVSDPKAVIKKVAVVDVKNILDAKECFILLDVRDKNEFDEGRIPEQLIFHEACLNLNWH